MTIVPISLLAFGFLMGLKHAFEADHVAAVSTVASNHKSIKKSSLLGMFWGFGHATSLIAVGLFVLLLKIKIPDRIALAFEFAVGAMLVLLGINILATMNKNKVHFHKHRHGKKEHIHFHSHMLDRNHNHWHLHAKQSILIGSIHGLAGSAALILLVLSTINSIFIGLFYIALFSIGSVIGMALVSSLISLPQALIPNTFNQFQRWIRVSSSFFSISIGLFIMKNIIFKF